MEELSDYLTDYEEVASSPLQEKTFFSTLINNEENQRLLLEFPLDNRHLILSRLHLFFNLYKYENSCKKVTLAFLPKFIYIYLSSLNNKSCNKNKKEESHHLEAFLLFIYNNEKDTLDGNGNGFRIPTLNTSSIYHDGTRMDVSVNSPATSDNLQHANYPCVRHLNAQNKGRVLSALFRVFNSRLGDYPKFVLKNFCDISLSLCTRGYPKNPGGSVVAGVGRIHLPGPVLLELLYGAYFCAYNDFQRLGNSLVDAIHHRATRDANTALLLATGSAKSVLMDQQHNSNIVSTTPSFSQVAKNMITNASFKTKKMGDDIPVVDNNDHHNHSHHGNNLSVITEELNAMNVSCPEPQQQQPEVEIREHKKDIKVKIKSKFPKLKKDKDRLSSTEVDKSPATPPASSKVELKIMNKNKDDGRIESLEQVEELIKKKKLIETETITLHSPESGTTIF